MAAQMPGQKKSARQPRRGPGFDDVRVAISKLELPLASDPIAVKSQRSDKP
jgi:hypothetical protein